MRTFGFTPLELRQLRALKTPDEIQKFLDDLPYNLRYTARSPKKVLHDRTASCLEGGIFGAAALRVLGFPPLIAHNRDLSFVVDMTSGAPLEVLDVDPWLDDVASGARRQPAGQP